MGGFRKATKQAKQLVISFQGASGAGKTFSALSVAKHMCPPGKRIAFIDTENSADLYGDHFDFDVDSDFGPFGKLNYGPDEWMKKLRTAAAANEYGVVVLDSLTHMWKGTGGILSQLDEDANAFKAKTGRFADTNALWKKFDPMYSKFMNDLRHLPFHVFFCLRAKQKTDRKTNEKGKTEITKLGLEAEFRDGFDFDVDAQFLIDENHVGIAKKHRLGACLDDKPFVFPGQNLAEVLNAWLVTAPAQTTVQAAVANDVSPDTRRAPPDTESPPAPVAEAAVPASLAEALTAKLLLATDLAELKTVAAEIKRANSENLLNDEEYNAISKVYLTRNKALKEKAA